MTGAKSLAMAAAFILKSPSFQSRKFTSIVAATVTGLPSF